MTFRTSRNHALQNYRDAFDLAARYCYMAGKAYEFETNLPSSHEGAVSPHLQSIVRARGLGHFDGEPYIGKGGLSEAMAKMKANYEVLRGQLGINNPQLEFSHMSLRTEQMRIYPTGSTEGAGSENSDEVIELGFDVTGAEADNQWKTALTDARVSDLWQVREYRNKCRPFAPRRYDQDGTPIPEPGIVLRFGTEIMAGMNFLAGRWQVGTIPIIRVTTRQRSGPLA